MEVWLFPYLPLAARCDVDGWEIIPREQLTTDDTTTAAMLGHALNVHAPYRMPNSARASGAFIRPPDGRVGGVFSDEHGRRSRALYHAVATATLDRNVPPARRDPDDHNTGWRICTTENTLMRRHGFAEDLYVAFRTGTMTEMLHSGWQLGVNNGVIDPPIDMKLPLVPLELDVAYVRALYGMLTDVRDDQPDLVGAITWLETAWMNTEMLDGARVRALRAGFDVLFRDASTEEVRKKLSKLLDEPDAKRTAREWYDRKKLKKGTLTELEWWFVQFALLRNKLAHGGPIERDDALFEDVHHVYHAEYQLRRAIKRTVANAGYPEVEQSEWARAARRYFEDGIEETPTEEEG